MEELINCKLFKVLSRNDTGETNSHQSGISIPKNVARSGIFPFLGKDELNPRVPVTFIDENGKEHIFQYIYYNDAFFGKSKTQGHDEFRLTCVKDYIRDENIKAGDSIWFSIDEKGNRKIGYKKVEKNNTYVDDEGIVVIKLSKNWHYIKDEQE